MSNSMASNRRPDAENFIPYDNSRPHQARSRDNRQGMMYEDAYHHPDSRDQNRQSPSPPRRYASPHDRYRNYPDGSRAGGQDSFSPRDWRARAERDSIRDNDRSYRERSSSPRRGSRGTYRDRDREGYTLPGHNSRSRTRSPQRARSPYFGGPPSKEVILEGLPLDMVEDDISRELKQYHHVEKLDDVRIIRDRQTKVSRGFGFLRFPNLEKSKAFVETNFPMIYLYGNGSTDSDDQAAKVRLAYSRERDDRNRGEKAEGEWTCKICTSVNFPGRVKCFRCQSPQIDMTALGLTAAIKPSEYLNIGDSDASPNGTPSQFLLIRGLEPTVTEDLLAKGVTKLYKPRKRSPSPSMSTSKKNNAKVASTTGDANLGAKDGSLRRVLLIRDRRSNESWRYGFAEFGTVDDAQAALTRFNSFEKFTISSKPVTANYVHAGVFVPVFSSSETSQKFTFSPIGNSATKLAYWDEQAWASELVVSSSTPKQTAPAKEQQFQSASDRAAAAAENEGLLKPGKESEAKVKKRKAETSDVTKQKKAAPAHLQFWSNRHAELHGVKVNSPVEKQLKPNDVLDDGSFSKPNPRENSTPIQTYADLNKKCCYLCSRQFKTEAEVNKHERLSQLHRDNLKNEELVSKAEAKMLKAGIPTIPQEESQEYRDRAKERRAAFGGSKKISLPLKKAPGQSDDNDAKDDKDTDIVPPPSKGAALLGKMGWSAGEGLGAQGTGMIAPVTTDMYVQGVGLGAQGGKIGDAAEEADRNTKGGYGGFLEKNKDKAKERFGRMS